MSRTNNRSVSCAAETQRPTEGRGSWYVGAALHFAVSGQARTASLGRRHVSSSQEKDEGGEKDAEI